MTMQLSVYASPPASSQRGAVLIVGLIMLLLMTIVGLAAIRGSGMQELMAGNMRDRNLAFQASEAGLRAGEAVVDAPGLQAFNGNNGLYEDLSQSTTPPPPTQWTDQQWGTNAAKAANMTFYKNLSGAPLYAVERLVMPVGAEAKKTGGAIDVASQNTLPPANYYRVTSRGTGGTANAAVILESTFKVPK